MKTLFNRQIGTVHEHVYDIGFILFDTGGSLPLALFIVSEYAKDAHGS